MVHGMTAAAEATTLYERDFHAWTQAQAAALRATAEGGAASLDLLNLAEEIESVGLGDGREMRSRLRTIVEHLLKLESSSARAPRVGWRETVNRERSELADLFDQSPSLRRRVPEALPDVSQAAGRLAARSLKDHGEGDAALVARLSAGGYDLEQVLGDWWPDDPSPSA